MDIIQSTLIKKTKPGVVRVYDYYDPGNVAFRTQNSFVKKIVENNKRMRDCRICKQNNKAQHFSCPPDMIMQRVCYIICMHATSQARVFIPLRATAAAREGTKDPGCEVGMHGASMTHLNMALRGV